MVRPWLSCLLLGLACAGPAHAAGEPPSLEVVTNRLALDWGERLRVKVIYQGVEDPGEPVIDAWQEDFVLEHRFSERATVADGRSQWLSEWHAYPRRPGRLTLGVIALGGAMSRPVSINVGVQQFGGAPLVPGVRLSSNTVRTGEQFRLDISLAEPGSLRRVTAGDFEMAGVTVLDSGTAPEDSGYRASWLLRADRPGQVLLELPALLVQLDGHRRGWFHFPRQPLQVVPLPAYIPVGLPVGDLRFAATLQSRAGEAWWGVTLESDGDLALALPLLRSQLADLAGDSQVLVGEPTLFERGGRRWSRVEARARVPDWSTGWSERQALSARFFSVAAGRLVTATAQLPAAWQLPRWFGWLLALSILAALLAGATWLLRRLRAALARRRWLRELSLLEDPNALRRHLLAGGGRRNLGEWAASHPLRQEAAGYADALNRACFAKAALMPPAAPAIWKRAWEAGGRAG